MSAPLYLLIDAGNTRIKWATATLYGPLKIRGDISTAQATSAWIHALAGTFPTHRAILGSVVPKLVPAFRRAFTGRFHLVTHRSLAPGFSFDYPRPRELGADRLAAAAAAHAGGRFPAITVSCGTATAFTVLNAKGKLCGGAIAPGLQAQLTSLIGATAQLPSIHLRMPRRALARSTQEAIRAGVMFGYIGGVREILRRLEADLPGRPRPVILLTGGNARYLASELGPVVKLRPLLVFEGLRIMAARAFPPLS